MKKTTANIMSFYKSMFLVVSMMVTIATAFQDKKPTCQWSWEWTEDLFSTFDLVATLPISTILLHSPLNLCRDCLACSQLEDRVRGLRGSVLSLCEHLLWNRQAAALTSYQSSIFPTHYTAIHTNSECFCPLNYPIHTREFSWMTQFSPLVPRWLLFFLWEALLSLKMKTCLPPLKQNSNRSYKYSWNPQQTLDQNVGQ